MDLLAAAVTAFGQWSNAGQSRRTQDMDQSLGTQLQTTLNPVPAFTWYSLPSGTLTFVNHRYADYLGLATDHPLRFGVETGVAFCAYRATRYSTSNGMSLPRSRSAGRCTGNTFKR